ncbi:glycosyltransferase family 39 protein [Nostoc sp.]|uniref:glycosyltransferase family 39 protein n=1 Tax=Nostoc sp. TaxID=1180 RepID=UPI002FFB25A7
MKIHPSLNLKLIALLLLWLFVTVINLNKAYHIDDTVHLETAQWILQEPLRPMSGQINWDENTGPIHLLNQPHFYFYLLAVWGSLWGFGELQMHLFHSLFTLACIIFIYLIAKVIIPSRAFLLTALLTLSPAFVVGQNLMVDIPLLSFWLAFFYAMIKPKVQSEKLYFILAGFMAGFACLIKYSSLPLIVVMLSYLIIRRRFHLIWTVSIPVLMLIIWSCFNYLDYGSIHIFDRPSKDFSLRRVIEMALSFLLCLGGILPYSPIYLRNLWHKKKLNLLIKITLVIILIFSAIIIAGVYMRRIGEPIINNYLVFLFYGNGIAVTILLSKFFLRNLETIFAENGKTILLLYLWIFFGALFTIIFAPFMATRHVLLVIVPITLLLLYFTERSHSLGWNITMLLSTALLTLVLSISDRIWANFYREKAALIRNELPSEANVYFTGHWGWQWYAKKNGMKQLEALNPRVQPGDYLVYPEGIHQQTLENIPPEFQLKVVKKYTAKRTRAIFFSTRGEAAIFYLSDFLSPPWTVTWHPIPPIVVYRIETRTAQQK